MKKIFVILVVILSTFSVQSQNRLKIEPLFKIGIFSDRNEWITSTYSGEPIRVPIPGSSGIPGVYPYESTQLVQSKVDKIDYYVTSGFRVSFQGFRIESENKIYCTTNDFTSNKPYLARFYLRAYYQTGKVKIGWEHLCVHPIRTENVGLVYDVRGGHDEFFISYNL